MYKISINYPYSEDNYFDKDYYLKTHIPMVKDALSPLGLKQVEVVFGQAAIMNKQPRFFAVANMYFEDIPSMGGALQSKGAELTGDIKNFTDVIPFEEISEVAESTPLV